VSKESCSSVGRAMLYMGIFAAASLALLYSFQDKILYMPGAPLRYIN